MKSQATVDPRPPFELTRHVSFYRLIGISIVVLAMVALFASSSLYWFYEKTVALGSLVMIMGIVGVVSTLFAHPTRTALNAIRHNVWFAERVYVDATNQVIDDMDVHDWAPERVYVWVDVRSTIIWLSAAAAGLGLLMVLFGINYFTYPM
jgi:hypothetical protein